MPHGTAGRRGHRGRTVEEPGEGLDREVVVSPVADRDPDPVVVGAHDEPLAEQPRRELAAVRDGHEEEVRIRRERREPDRGQRAGEPLALLDHRAHVRRRGERRHRQGRRERRDRRRRLPGVQLGRHVHGGERVADPRTGEREGLRERPQHDHAVVEQRHRGLAEVLEVRLVDDERPRLGQRAHRAVRAVRPAGERQDGALVSGLGARQQSREPVQRISGVVGDRDRVARARIAARAEQDQVVGPDPEHDVVRLDAVVAGDRLAQLAVAARRIAVDRRQGARDRTRAGRGQRQRRRVLVVAHDLRGVDPRQARDLVVRGRPRVGGELRRERPHRRTAAACAGMPSAAASASTVGRSSASPSGVSRWVVTGLRNVSIPSPPTDRAQPLVGRTWLPPVA